jgi:hypothetical protein
VNPAAQEVMYNAVVDRTMKEQTTIKREFRRKWHDIILLNIVGRKTDPVIVSKAQMRIGISTDRSIKDGAAVLVAITREVSSSASQAKTKRGTGANTVALPTTELRISYRRSDRDRGS